MRMTIEALRLRNAVAEIIAEGVCHKCKKPYREHEKSARHNFDNDSRLTARAVLAFLEQRTPR